MRNGFDRILLAVRDVEALSPAVLRKAAQLARSARSRLEVYHAIAEPVVLMPPRTAPANANYEHVLQSAARKSQARLEKAVARARLRGLRVHCRADWDYPAFEAVVRRAKAMRADLVVAIVRRHAPTARFFLRNVDWELIRHCQAPLLLLKSSRPYKRSTVLAAVDPLHAADKPARLDRKLLSIGARAANKLRGSLHMVHAWQPLAVAAVPMAGMPGPMWLPQAAEDQHSRSIEKAFVRLARAAAVPPNRRHLLLGTVPDVFSSALKASKAQVMVMGAISRRGIARLLIGNTAERMLDELPCDVLVVKPPGFANKVPDKPRGPSFATQMPPL
jgi:universal stress protein E